MVKHSPAIFLICLSLIYSTSGNLVSDIIKDFFTKGVLIENVNLGEDVASLSNLELKFDNSVLNVTDEGLLGFNLFVDTEVKLTGEYNITYLDLPGLFPIRGIGTVDATLKKTNIQLKVNVGILSPKIEVEIFNISVNTAKVIFENLFDDPDLSSYWSDLVSGILPGVVKIITDIYPHYVDPILQHFLGEIINCVIFHSNELESCLQNITFPDYPIDPYFVENDTVNSTKFFIKN